MANPNLFITVAYSLQNKVGSTLNYGDVVVLSGSVAKAVVTTTTSGFVAGVVGVVLEPAGIANDAFGMIATCGYIPRINLASSAALADFFKTHTVARQATPHATPSQTGDFGQVLTTGTTPEAILFGNPKF